MNEIWNAFVESFMYSLKECASAIGFLLPLVILIVSIVLIIIIFVLMSEVIEDIKIKKVIKKYWGFKE